MRFTVQIDAREVTVMLDRISERATDPRPFLRKAAEWMREEHQEAFNTAGRNLESPWRPLAATTRRAKTERGYDQRTLVRRGDLMRSVTTTGPNHIERITRTGLTFGTSSPTARLHRGRGRNPVQAPRDLSPMREMLLAWLIDGRA